MVKFNRDGDRGFGGNRGGGGRFGGGNFKRDNFGGGNRGPVSMFDAVCSECQKACQVPFRPTNEKPVYCSDCFTKRGGPARTGRDNFPRKDFGNRSDSRPPMRSSYAGSDSGNGEIKKQLEMINVKLDKLIRAIEGQVKPIVIKSEEKKVVEKVEEKPKKVVKKKAIKK